MRRKTYQTRLCVQFMGNRFVQSLAQPSNPKVQKNKRSKSSNFTILLIGSKCFWSKYSHLKKQYSHQVALMQLSVKIWLKGLAWLAQQQLSSSIVKGNWLFVVNVCIKPFMSQKHFLSTCIIWTESRPPAGHTQEGHSSITEPDNRFSWII